MRIVRDYGVQSGMIEGDSKLIGVWADLDEPTAWPAHATPESLGDRRIGKLGAIGVRLSRWVTMHGFALNVSTDLAGYASIVACGIQDRGVTSLAALGADVPPLVEVASRAIAHFSAVFGASVTFRVEATGATLP